MPDSYRPRHLDVVATATRRYIEERAAAFNDGFADAVAQGVIDPESDDTARDPRDALIASRVKQATVAAWRDAPQTQNPDEKMC